MLRHEDSYGCRKSDDRTALDFTKRLNLLFLEKLGVGVGVGSANARTASTDAVGTHSGTDVQPILQLPLVCTRPLPFKIRPLVMTQSARVSEEVYEYQRYDPLYCRQESKWLAPYIVGDPPAWADASGAVSTPRESFQLPNDSWDWLADWAVDFGKPGMNETDAEGWEYSAAFMQFTVSSSRRAMRPTDQVQHSANYYTSAQCSLRASTF